MCSSWASCCALSSSAVIHCSCPLGVPRYLQQRLWDRRSIGRVRGWSNFRFDIRGVALPGGGIHLGGHGGGVVAAIGGRRGTFLGAACAGGEPKTNSSEYKPVCYRTSRHRNSVELWRMTILAHSDPASILMLVRTPARASDATHLDQSGTCDQSLPHSRRWRRTRTVCPGIGLPVALAEARMADWLAPHPRSSAVLRRPLGPRPNRLLTGSSPCNSSKAG